MNGHVSVNNIKHTVRCPGFLAEQQELRLDPSRVILDNLIAGDSSKSEVWSGKLIDQETGSHHRVAVKRFSLQTAEDHENVKREIEILALAARRCHSSTRFWGWSEDSLGKVCVVMTRYEQSLASLLQSKDGAKLSIPEVRRLGMQIARAVAELHDQNIVLSDLKPANVLLDEYKQCIITDFGISTLQSGKGKDLDGLHGTFNYMSPESFDSETFGKISTKVDAWSFACCIIEMVSGRVPWAGTTMSAICFKVTSSRESPSIPNELPSHVRELLSRCLAFHSDARPTFREIFAVFNTDWGESASKAKHVRSISLESSQAQIPPSPTNISVEVDTLRAEKQAWMLERERFVARMRHDAARVAELEHNIVEHQGVNEVLQGQLKLMVEGMKHQQQQVRSPKHSEHTAPHFEVQLEGCQEALNQCMKQKEVAKDMLRQESARSAALALELKVMREQQGRLHSVLQTLAAENMSAQRDVAWLEANNLYELAQSAQKPVIDLTSPDASGQAARILAAERRLADARPLPLPQERILQPHGSHVYDWDTDSPGSTRESDHSEGGVSPLDPREPWGWKLQHPRDKARLPPPPHLLSAASTPALSVQSSWDSNSSAARPLTANSHV